MNRFRVTPSVIPNLFTAMNMFSGFFSIISASQGNYTYAGWLIIIAAIFDTLDGFMARLTKSSSELGVELDSLSDVISFGAAPSFLLYTTYFHQFETSGVIISSLPLIAGGFRLARFNVQLVGFDKKFFTGLPIPSAALTIVCFILSYYNNGFGEIEKQIIIPMVLILSFLMVSKVKYDTIPKFSLSEIKRNPLLYIAYFIALIILIIYKVKGLFFIFVFMIVFGIFRQIFKYFSNNKVELKVFKATVLIKRRPSILDPQGVAVEKGAKHLGISNIRNTRIGKLIEFDVDLNDRTAAEKEVNDYCSKLLANPIMEDFEFTLSEYSPSGDEVK
jgi:CDP-diacylglycerol--serine O-phosphatidyltransferase